ncbi:MAG: hypothetical protein ACI9NT_002248 [Bacteroidia bacterium]|jgi:hypothetical protein
MTLSLSLHGYLPRRLDCTWGQPLCPEGAGRYILHSDVNLEPNGDLGFHFLESALNLQRFGMERSRGFSVGTDQRPERAKPSALSKPLFLATGTHPLLVHFCRVLANANDSY